MTEQNRTIRPCRKCGRQIEIVPTGMKDKPAVALDLAAPVYAIGMNGRIQPIAAYVDHAEVCKGEMEAQLA